MNTRQRLSTRSTRFALRILLVALLGLAAHAATRHVTDGTRTAPAAGAAPHPSGMLAAIDPATGLLTAPTPEQSRDLLGSSPRKPGHVEITQRPDGTEIGTLDTSYLHYSVAHIDAAGRLRTDCTVTPAVTSTLPDAPAPEQ